MGKHRVVKTLIHYYLSAAVFHDDSRTKEPGEGFGVASSLAFPCWFLSRSDFNIYECYARVMNALISTKAVDYFLASVAYI